MHISYDFELVFRWSLWLWLSLLAISNDLNGVEDSENTGERDEATIVLPEDVYEDEENQCYYLMLIDNQVGDDGGVGVSYLQILSHDHNFI